MKECVSNHILHSITKNKIKKEKRKRERGIAMELSYYIYRFLDKDNRVLYIGQTENLKERIKRHKTRQRSETWYDLITTIEFFKTATKPDMDIAEKYLISKIKPIHNIVYVNNDALYNMTELDCVKWTKYNYNIFKYYYENFIAPTLSPELHITPAMVSDNEPKSICIENLVTKKLKALKESVELHYKMYKDTLDKLVIIGNRYTNTDEYQINHRNYIFTHTMGWCDGRGRACVVVGHLNNTESAREIIKTRSKMNELYKKCLSLNKEYKESKAKSVNSIYNKEKVKNIDKEVAESMIKHNAATIGDLKEKLIKEVISDKLNKVKKSLDQFKWYDYSATMYEIGIGIQVKMGVWDKLFGKNDHFKMSDTRLEIARQIIKEVEKELIETYGDFTEIVIMENCTYPLLDSRLLIPTAKIIRKIA